MSKSYNLNIYLKPPHLFLLPRDKYKINAYNYIYIYFYNIYNVARVILFVSFCTLTMSFLRKMICVSRQKLVQYSRVLSYAVSESRQRERLYNNYFIIRLCWSGSIQEYRTRRVRERQQDKNLLLIATVTKIRPQRFIIIIYVYVINGPS